MRALIWQLAQIATAPDTDVTDAEKSRAVRFKTGWREGYSLNPDRMNFQDGVTIEARANFGRTAEYFERILDWGDDSWSNNIIFCRDGCTQNLIFEVWHDGENYGRFTTTTNPLKPNAGMHTYTATLGEDVIPRVFIDGVEQSGVVTNGGEDDDFRALPQSDLRPASRIGFSLFGDESFAGELQYLRVYNVNLDERTIRDHARTNARADSLS